MDISLSNIVVMLLLQGLFLGYYHLFLSRTASFQFSRFFLVFTFLFSVIAPFVSKELVGNWSMYQAYLLPQIDLAATEEIYTSTVETNFGQGLFYLYMFGSILVAARLLYGLIQMSQIIYKSDVVKDHKCYTIATDKVATSSFGPILFWNPNPSMSDEESQLIKQHELSHIQQWHSLDVLMMEVAIVLMWINPFVYLYKAAITQNHEFIADRSGAESKKKTYAALLLKASLNAHGIALASHFSKINTKRRIMELAKTNNRVSRPIHYVATMFIAAVAIFTLSFSNAYAQSSGQDKVYEEVDQLPKYVGGMPALGSKLQQVLDYPKEERKKGTQGKVFVGFVVTKTGKVTQVEVEKGISTLCDEAAVAAVSKLPDWEPGIHNGQPVNVKIVLPINFALDDGKKVSKRSEG